MDPITGLIFGLFVGWLIGIIRAWNFKVFIALFIILVSFAIILILIADTTLGGGYSYVLDWTNVAIIFGTAFGIWCGEATYEEMKKKED